ncbi:hypothetical protein PIB30_060257 [Stylosanthes scabra]|uniref:PHD-type domain-containing protein n=1 Tax=Stylosanthes scabra TaxID=79078 RepID=A0ABU6QLH5_9FABA|nr:hypothetical protein [Stylosanthes scabra]
MARGGKISGKRSFRNRARSKEGGSDDSDEDYVVSDEDEEVSDCPDEYSSSLDGCASEESYDAFIDEEEDDEIQQVKKFNRSEARNGVCGRQKNTSKSTRKRGRIAYAKHEEQEEQEAPEEQEAQEEQEQEQTKVEEQDGDGDGDGYGYEDEDEDGGGGREDEDGDEDFNYDDNDDNDDEDEDEDFDFDDDEEEFSLEEGDYLVEEEETRERKKKNNSMKVGKKISKRKVSMTSTKLRKRKKSRASNKPLKKKRRNRGLKRKVRCNDVDDFIDNGPASGTKRRKKLRRPRRMLLPEDSNSDAYGVLSGSSEYEFTISEEEREQVREAKELCQSSRRNLRRSSQLMKNEEIELHEDLHQRRKPQGQKGKEKIDESQGRKVVVEVPERDQVYQPTEEELRSYIDPYEDVICSECHLGGDDGLMLLCDICDSPAHTYCVGLGREVPEGNWYCDGCRPVAFSSSSSQVQERVTDPSVPTQNLSVRPSIVLNERESIDLNLISSPRTSFSQGFGHISSARVLGRSVEVASQVPGGGAPTLSERRWIHRHIHQILSTSGRTSGTSATNTSSNLYNSQTDQSRETNATQHTRTQDAGTSYLPFLDERLCNNVSPPMQNADSSSMRISNARRSVVQDSVMLADRSMNGVLLPVLVASTPSVADYDPVHPFNNRTNMVTDGSLPVAIKEDSNFETIKQQLKSMVKRHLRSLSRDVDLGNNTFKDIARSSTHTVLAACGLEHKKSEVRSVPAPDVCPHIELMAGGQTSLIRGCCSTCFDSFVKDVVKNILDRRMSSQWLRLGL